jgi:hypothetical protein
MRQNFQKKGVKGSDLRFEHPLIPPRSIMPCDWKDVSIAVHDQVLEVLVSIVKGKHINW